MPCRQGKSRLLRILLSISGSSFPLNHLRRLITIHFIGIYIVVSVDVITKKWARKMKYFLCVIGLYAGCSSTIGNDLAIEQQEASLGSGSPITLERDRIFVTFTNCHHPDSRVGYRIFEHTPIVYGPVPRNVQEADIDMMETVGPYEAKMLEPIDDGLITRANLEGTWVSGIFWEGTSHITNHHPADCLHAIVSIGNVPPHAKRAIHGKIYWLRGTKSDLEKHFQRDFSR